MTTPLTNRITQRVCAEYRPSDKILQKMKEEIAYVKKMEDLVHKEILPRISRLLQSPNRFDEIARHDLQGLEERIFACIATVNPLLTRYEKNTDNIDLILNLLIEENRNFTTVLCNGTLRGKHATLYKQHLVFDDEDYGPYACIDAVGGTINSWSNDR